MNKAEYIVYYYQKNILYMYTCMLLSIICHLSTLHRVKNITIFSTRNTSNRCFKIISKFAKIYIYISLIYGKGHEISRQGSKYHTD